METTAALLDDLNTWLSRYVVLTPEQSTAVALWITHTYVFDSGDTSPYLIVSSAEKRSGKTRLLECLNSVVSAPIFTSSMTEASLFRAIDKWAPTLLIDETDALFKNGKRDPSERQEAIRAILNSGYRRGSYTIRCNGVGGRQDVEKLGIYCPKALAGIGHLPDTIRDRGLPIRLQRRTREEAIEPFRFRVGATEGPVFVDRLQSFRARWEVTLQRAEPVMPPELDDRAQDAYEILIAIAELAGEEWRARAVAALISLRGAEVAQEQSTGGQLLDDLAIVIPHLQGKHVATVDLLALLYEHGENPWEEWWGEATHKRAAMRLAKILREYGISRLTFRHAVGTAKGYETAALGATVARYAAERWEHGNIPANPEEKVVTSAEAVTTSESGDLQGLLPRYHLNDPMADSDEVSLFERGTSEWIATASASDLAEWKREVLDS